MLADYRVCLEEVRRTHVEKLDWGEAMAVVFLDKKKRKIVYTDFKDEVLGNPG